MPHVFLDGSCVGKSRAGGYACVFSNGEKICGGETNTTNNRMELFAVIVAVEKDPNIHIITDSQYVKDGIEKWILNWKKNGWKTASGQPVKNQDLWKRLDSAKTALTTFEWVKGHSGHEGNEEADKLARGVAKLIEGA